MYYVHEIDFPLQWEVIDDPFLLCPPESLSHGLTVTEMKKKTRNLWAITQYGYPYFPAQYKECK